MTRVKICGITNLEDAVASVDAGADMLGFNFCEKSPRFIEKNIAAEIINHIPERVECVGVFVNYGPPEDVMEVCSQLGLAAAQLHGDETAEYCKAITGYPVIKAFRAGPGFNSADIVPFDVDAIMLDAFHPFQRGGTGHSVDWSLASRVRQMASKFFLAGGLSSENVREAIATVSPDVVDTCSKLESGPGKKDHQKLREFLIAVKGVASP